MNIYVSTYNCILSVLSKEVQRRRLKKTLNLFVNYLFYWFLGVADCLQWQLRAIPPRPTWQKFGTHVPWVVILEISVIVRFLHSLAEGVRCSHLALSEALGLFMGTFRYQKPQQPPFFISHMSNYNTIRMLIIVLWWLFYCYNISYKHPESSL